MLLSRLTLDPRHPDTVRWLGDCHLLHRLVMSGFPDAAGAEARAKLGVLYRVDVQPRERHRHVLVQSVQPPRWTLETGAVVSTEGPKDLTSLEARFASGARFRFRLRANPTRRVHRRATMGPDLRELDTAGRWRESAEIPEVERTGRIRRTYAEPVTAVRTRGDRRIGKRVELRREEDRLAWLARRGRDHDGFALLTAHISAGLDGSAAERRYMRVRADPAPRLEGRHPKLAARREAGEGVDPRLTIATALFEGELEVTDSEAFARAFRVGIGPGKAFGCGLLSLAPLG